MAAPTLGPAWPFLPVVRRLHGQEKGCGPSYDALHVSSRTGFSATVVLGNLFCLLRDETKFLAMSKETFDSPEEVFGAG
jgi:hypothetical protein